MFKLLEFEELYLKTKLAPGLVSLYSNRIIQQIAGGLIGIFLPIFLFIYFGSSIHNVLLYYIVSFTLFGLLVPLGAMLMSRIGLKVSMILGSLFLVSYFVFLYLLNNNWALALFLAIGGATLFRLLYWIPYHTDFAKFTDRRSRGKEIALLVSVTTLVSIFLPFIAGLIISKFGFSILFLIAIIIASISIFPILLLRSVQEKYSYSYFQTFKELFKKKNRKLFWAYSGDGAETMVGAIIWPIFIFQLLKGNYLSVGIVTSLIVLASIALRLIIGAMTDKMSKRRLIKVGSVLYFVGWIGKIFVQTTFQIFVVSSYHSFAAIIRRTPFTTLMYEQAADRGHYVDEYTVLREVALNIGRVFMLILLFILFYFVGLTFAFILAAIASLLINTL